MMRRLCDDRGSTELFVLAMVPAVLFALGLVVDLGGRSRALDRAAWCAQQAARAGAQSIDAGSAQDGVYPGVLASTGSAAAQSSIAGSGMSGTVQLDGTRVTVTCTTGYSPFLLGTGTWTLSATETARSVRGIVQEG